MRRHLCIALGAAAAVLPSAAVPALAKEQWPPVAGAPDEVATAIAAHVAPRYRASANGGRLVVVTAGRPAIRFGSRSVPLKLVTVRKRPDDDTGSAVYAGDRTQLYTLCGTARRCAIPGMPSAERGRLVRREALELALLTFTYSPTVDAVLVYLPRSPFSPATDVLYLRRSDLRGELAVPLERTLPLETPPLPADSDTAEAATIDRLTLPRMFHWLPIDGGTAGAALVLDPAR